ncbi:protein of unknown function (plasmid) [Cupriavidus taiwanensis]|uniref:Uncharacterized protein n=1 Tax=Cupriavidus taiwanensis TaxID=164546 RepID=A0A375IM27_9BURK|nr:protein of unknown function [Cupriavidus taiwanensis]
MLPSPACGRGAGGEGWRVASTMRLHFVEIPTLTPTPLPQAVWTGDMGNTCARTWVTVQSPV